MADAAIARTFEISTKTGFDAHLAYVKRYQNYPLPVSLRAQAGAFMTVHHLPLIGLRYPFERTASHR